MDSVTDYHQYFALTQGLARTDRWVMAHRPTFDFLSRILAGKRRPLHIVDVGCGNGDLLRRCARWAQRRRLPVKLTGIDLHPYAIHAAIELTGRVATQPRIDWINDDALSVRLAAPADVILSCHFTHHLSDEQLVAFIRWMEKNSEVGWFINDLHREVVPWHIFRALSKVLKLAPILRRDGLVSIRRSFQPEDWQALCAGAGLRRGEFRVQKRFPARLCVERRKTPSQDPESSSGR